ncbi:hypothetical protein C8Q78DRAFT_1198191 [Trametes maxima]|nr:hypothetical protein C8Q78DRAFT_1198191 [Trametes maxima]
MWCTRWYLPLLLLPFPIASPFYLILWILTISLHARPCFYCLALLTTMCISLCYWPPIPIDTPLARPWSENITTFADALRWKMPNLPHEKIPSIMSMEEHCWCDVSGGVFSPVNLTMWEEASVNRAVERLEKDLAIEEETERRRQCEVQEVDANTNGTSCAHDLSAPLLVYGAEESFPFGAYSTYWVSHLPNPRRLPLRTFPIMPSRQLNRKHILSVSAMHQHPVLFPDSLPCRYRCSGRNTTCEDLDSPWCWTLGGRVPSEDV